jgi:glycosyltransferase involved in cell wall biosynthesis
LFFSGMKLLVLAQVPPPLHGQSAMIRSAVDGLPAHGVPLHHVNFRLARDAADIGRWRPGKVAAVLGACARAVAARFRHGCDTLYYVPAPAKRGALYRDWVVMLLCRPFYPRLVLHWHAAGLGEWLAAGATAPERFLTRLLLGRAQLSIVLGDGLRADADALRSRRIEVVRNGINDPCPGFARSLASPGNSSREAVFLGLGLPGKGLLEAAAAVIAANRDPGATRWRLSAAGALPDPIVAQEFARLAAASKGAVRHVGFVTGETKHALLAGADALVFPTCYEAEAQPLVVAEALAYDLSVIVTRWRAVAENLPAHGAQVVAPGSMAEIVAALGRLAREPAEPGLSRRHFLAYYTRERFLERLASVLRAGIGDD